MNKSLVLKWFYEPEGKKIIEYDFLPTSEISSSISQGKIISVNWLFATGSLSEPPKKINKQKLERSFKDHWGREGGE